MSFIPFCLTDLEPIMATLSIKQLKARATALYTRTTSAFCCVRPRIDTDYNASRDEVFGTCRNCDREVFRFRSEEVVAQSPDAARSDKELSRARRGDPVVKSARSLRQAQAEVAERDRALRDAPRNQEKRARLLAEQVQAGIISVDAARALLEEESKPKKPDKPDTKTTAIDTNRFANLEDD